MNNLKRHTTNYLLDETYLKIPKLAKETHRRVSSYDNPTTASRDFVLELTFNDTVPARERHWSCKVPVSLYEWEEKSAEAILNHILSQFQDHLDRWIFNFGGLL